MILNKCGLNILNMSRSPVKLNALCFKGLLKEFHHIVVI